MKFAVICVISLWRCAIEKASISRRLESIRLIGNYYGFSDEMVFRCLRKGCQTFRAIRKILEPEPPVEDLKEWKRKLTEMTDGDSTLRTLLSTPPVINSTEIQIPPVKKSKVEENNGFANISNAETYSFQDPCLYPLSSDSLSNRKIPTSSKRYFERRKNNRVG